MRARNYELVMMLSPEATEDEVSATVGRVHDFITNKGGSVEEHQAWGLRRLAFPVSGFREGNYMLTHFALNTDVVAELNSSLKASEDVFRFLVTKV